MAVAGKTPEKRNSGRDDSSKLVMVMNVPLVGMPAAYAVSNSVTVTVVTAVVALVTAVAYLASHLR